MSSLNEQGDLTRRAGTADVAARMQNKLALEEMLFAGIQAVGGAALAVYTYKNSGSLIGPSVCSAIALGGTFNVLRNMRKIFWRSASNEEDESWSVNNVATGTIIYFGSLYAFSEAWRSNHKLWIFFYGSASLGFSYAVGSTYSKSVTTMKPLIKACQLAFEPALIVGGASYLLFFRNHEEEWVYWFPLVTTGLTGFTFALRSLFTAVDMEDLDNLLLQATEMLMGGCLVTVSSISLAIYVWQKEIHRPWISYTLATGTFGALVIVGAITSIQWFAGVNEQVAVSIGHMLTAPVVICFACLMVKYSESKGMACAMFPFLVGGGYAILFLSVYDLYITLPRPVFIRYCQRAWGPILIVGSSTVSAYIGYRFGWGSRYPLLMSPFVSAGIYITYKGLSGMDES